MMITKYPVLPAKVYMRKEAVVCILLVRTDTVQHNYVNRKKLNFILFIFKN